MPPKNNDQETMNPLQIIERGWWALLIRINAMVFPFVVMFFSWEVRTLARHETELQKIDQWKSGFINYPNDANDLLVRVQAKTDIQFSTISASIGALRDTLTRIETEQKIREQLRNSTHQ